MNNLFNQKILAKKAEEEVDLSKHNFSERRKALNKWINNLENGVLDKSKEEEFQGEFLYDIFTAVLRAVNKSDGKNEWNLERETKTKLDGQKADGVLGFFDADGKKDVRAVIELKGAKVSLDARQKRTSDTRTPVEQAFNYAPKYGKNCQWVIVSNYKEIRLYRANDMTEYQVFFLEKLKDDLEFKKFIYILSFDALVGTEKKKAKTIELSEEYQKNQAEIEKKFYNEYKNIRLHIFENMRKNNPAVNENTIIEKVQKLLDRFLFICFCEDKGLLPNEIFYKTLEKGKNFGDIFEVFKILCNWINLGNPRENISHFNGGLFKNDDVLESLYVDNDVFEEMKKISEYDFDSELNENVLGHIFEQSISDIEDLKKELNGEEFDKKKGKRKKDGIFYTPKYITKYIVENSIKNWLDDKRKELGEDKLPELSEADFEIKYSSKKSDERIYSKNYKKHIEFWTKYREAVKNIKVVDPACGSGAFLITAFEYLLNYNNYLNDKIFDLTGTKDLFSDTTREILQNNIFGVDLNKESVEITKLSLWLKTADKNKTLATLENNIKCGNSLIDDAEIAGELAFDWEKEFPQVFKNGGFDVVIGNPPYVDIKSLNPVEVKYYFKRFLTTENRVNLYSIFIEKGIEILSKNGILSFINPNSMLVNDSYIKLRNLIFSKITHIVKLPDNVFEEAKVETIIFEIKNSENKINLVNVIKYDKNEKITSIDENKAIIIYKSDWNTKEKHFNIYISKREKEILDKIENESLKLENIADFTLGITPYDKYRGHDEDTIKKRLFHSDTKIDSTYKPLITGENIQRYFIDNKIKEYIKYGEWLGAKREERFFNEPRILIRQIISGKPPRIYAGYTEKSLYFTQIGFGIISKNKSISNKYILVILNSLLINFYHKYMYLDLEKDLFQKILIANCKKLPIKEISLQEQQPFIEKADKMLFLNKNLQEISQKFQRLLTRKFELEKLTTKLQDWYFLDFLEFIKELKKAKIKLSLKDEMEWEEIFLEKKEEAEKVKNEIEITDKEIDGMVYELYGLSEEEIKIIEGEK
ncbi:Eco57I restriction-modification methylase domain-containing protein [Leptotrichia hongkongensis]|uniref:Eco57I restriction-modification methylase domain-containing protein n=1 Tax=Leptotrichia hongkongensis TaxID=554406 RepID=UPI0035A96384